MAWYEFKNKFEYDGSKELRLEHLEAMAHTPFTNNDTGGMASYIDKFQAYVAELETIAPTDYSDFKLKRMLLSNIKSAFGIQHLIQKCRDDETIIGTLLLVYCNNVPCVSLIYPIWSSMRSYVLDIVERMVDFYWILV